MKLTVGTFNLNNLFSRFNFEFQAEVPGLKEGTIKLKKVQKLITNFDERSVSYEGKALKHKNLTARNAISRRIKEMNLDILGVQEVEDIETLRYFVRHELSNNASVLYPYIILIEANDPRLIDLALLSKYPIGAATTWQHATHPDNPNERVFSRDLLQVEILTKDRNKRLLTIFNTHLKSHFVRFNEAQLTGHEAANKRRKQQAEVAANIIAKEMQKNDNFILMGDMNDPIDSADLKPLTSNPKLQLVNGLSHPAETRSITVKSGKPPKNTAWTHRFKAAGQPARYELFDHIWLSKTLATKQIGSFIDRRSKLEGDGSDHDPAWVALNI